MRTIIDLPEKDREALETICRQHKLSRAEAIRRAVAMYIAEQQINAPDTFGIWRDRSEDALTTEDRLRGEWGSR